MIKIFLIFSTTLKKTIIKKRKKKKRCKILFLSLFQIWKASSLVNTNGIPVWKITGSTTLWCSLTKEENRLVSSTFKLYISCIKSPSLMCIGHKFLPPNREYISYNLNLSLFPPIKIKLFCLLYVKI